MIQLALWAGTAAVLLSVVQILCILMVRRVGALVDDQRFQTVEAWQRLLVQSRQQVPEALPAISTSQSFLFLRLWNEAYETLLAENGGGAAEEALQRLRTLARRLRMDRNALRMLRDRSARQCFVAATSLGYMHAREAWEPLQRLTTSENPYLSMAAARALVHIDAARALPLLQHLLRERTDWPPHASPRLFHTVQEANVQALVRRAASME